MCCLHFFFLSYMARDRDLFLRGFYPFAGYWAGPLIGLWHAREAQPGHPTEEKPAGGEKGIAAAAAPLPHPKL
jgi:hypothetical protein